MGEPLEIRDKNRRPNLLCLLSVFVGKRVEERRANTTADGRPTGATQERENLVLRTGDGEVDRLRHELEGERRHRVCARNFGHDELREPREVIQRERGVPDVFGEVAGRADEEVAERAVHGPRLGFENTLDEWRRLHAAIDLCLG